MKKILIFLLLAIFNQNSFCAQAQAEVKVSGEEETKAKNDLLQLINKLLENVNKGDDKQIQEEIEKIKKFIVDSKIDVNTSYQFGNTPLILLAAFPKLNNLSFWLIDNGANVNSVGEWRRTALSWASTGIGNPELAKYIIKKDPRSIKARDHNSRSVLYNSLNNNPNKEFIKILLINGADFKKGDVSDKLKYLDYQAQKKIFDEILKELIDEYRQKIKDYVAKLKPEFLAKTPLLGDLISMAQQYTDEQIIDNIIEIRQMLGELKEPIDNESRIDEINKLFQDLIYKKELNENEKKFIVKKIKNRFEMWPIDVNIVLERKDTPLTALVTHPEFNDLAFWLIDHGADVNKPINIGGNINPEYGSPLSFAADSPNLDLIKVLIERGANVNFASPYFSILMNVVFHVPKNLDEKEYEKNFKTWKDKIKLLLINGAHFKENESISNLKDEINQIFNEIRQEIINEYFEKSNLYKEKIKTALNSDLLPELCNIVTAYSIPYRDGILDNIMQIRYELGELSPIQRRLFEQQQNQQAQPAQAAPRQAMAANQQAAAD